VIERYKISFKQPHQQYEIHTIMKLHSSQHKHMHHSCSTKPRLLSLLFHQCFDYSISQQSPDTDIVMPVLIFGYDATASSDVICCLRNSDTNIAMSVSTVVLENNNNNNDRFTAFDPGQPG